MNAILEDELEMLLDSNTTIAADDDAQDDKEPDVQPMEIDSDDIVAYVDVQEMLRKLKVSAPSLFGDDQTEAIGNHVDRLLRAMFIANAKKPMRDSTLHAYFQKK